MFSKLKYSVTYSSYSYNDKVIAYIFNFYIDEFNWVYNIISNNLLGAILFKK